MIRIATRFHPTDKTWSEPLERPEFSQAMLGRGVCWGVGERIADVIFADSEFMEETPRPHILFDRVDQACFGNKARSVVDFKNTMGVIKPVSYGAWRYHNSHASEGRYLGYMLTNKKDDHRPPVDEFFLKRTEVCTTLAHQYAGMFPWMEDVKWNQHRNIDMSFIGNTHYSGMIYPFLHRKKLCEEMAKLPRSMRVVCFDIGLHGYQPMSQESFMDVMVRSKVVVSPFGIGEYTFRDHMAMIAGCVLVKPLAPQFNVSFNPYVHAHWTLRDWSRLEDAFEQAMLLQPAFQDYSSYMREKFFDINSLADIMASHVKKFLG